MIKFDRSVRAIYLKDLANSNPSHAEKLLLVVAQLSNGIVGEHIGLSKVRGAWVKGVFKVVYHPSYVVACNDEDWISRPSAGVVALTDHGLAHINSLASSGPSDPLVDLTELVVFTPKQTHDFDKYLRAALSSAKNHIRIADSHVDGTIFDNILHVLTAGVRVDLMFNHHDGPSFLAQAKRFKIQHSGFTCAKYPKLHDRYVVIDDIGFVIGPSLKDAAVNSPAVLVKVGSEQSKKLIDLFDNIYSKQRKLV